MSRIGKSPIALPKGVEVTVSKGNLVTVKGPKGQLSEQLDADISVSIEDGELNVLRPTESKRHRSMHGLYRALVNNMVEGVTNGFVKEMEVIGVGYRVANTGQLLELTIGYSHPILFALPEEIKLSTAMEKGKSPLIRMECIDKQLLGQVAAKIRSFRKPEPYKGKGIRFVGEIVRRKAGKTAGKK
ncbi:MAG: 50S ribosomal protein L6 [Saprospiraceae bacterium]|nr:50S ribosomal protein L6 [Saprospiraceae bacterium]